MFPVLAAGTLREFLIGKSVSLGLFTWTIGPTGAMVLAGLVHVALVGLFFGIPALVFIWAERKVAGRIQDRLGPTRVGGRFGWLQSIADGIKLLQKEDIVPQAADKPLFLLAPYLVVVASFSAYMFLAFSDGWVAMNSDVALFAMLAVLSLEVIGIILAGYSSGSKWALFGGMREAAQVVSYEIPLAICAVIPIVSAGTLNFVEIGRMQQGPFWNWLIFHDPFTFLAFFVFFTVGTASCKRAPFDLAEAESELVAGFHTEYSGMRWSFFFLAEYASMFAVGGIATLLFLGGWNTGLGIERILEPAGSFVVNLFGFVVFVTKASLMVFVQIWIRWTLPRLRIDQVMMTCLKYLIPIACFLFFGAIVWPLALSATLGRPTLFPVGSPLGERAASALTAEQSPADSPYRAAPQVAADDNRHQGAGELLP